MEGNLNACVNSIVENSVPVLLPAAICSQYGLKEKLTTILRCNIKAKFNEHVESTRHFMYRKK